MQIVAHIIPERKFLGLFGYLFLVIFTFTLSISASDQIQFKTWNTENGLPQNSVQAIAQTPDGYLWLATRDGLARFDGIRFKIFQKSNTPELPTNRLHWVTTDDVGRLWIFPEASPQLVLYDNGEFRVFERGVDYDFDGVPENWTEGGSTVFTANGTDFVYHDGTFSRRPAIVQKRELGIEKGVTIWVDDDTNYYSITGTTVKLHPRDLANPLTRGKTAPLAPYLAFEQNAEGRISKLGYVRKNDAFWFFLDLPKGRTLVRFRRGQLEPSSFVDEKVHNMLLDQSGNLWMGHLEDGMYRVDAGSMESDDITSLRVNHITSSEGLAGNTVLRLFRDKDENIWVGVHEGLQLVKDEPSVKVISSRDGLPSNNIYAVAQDARGSVWFGAWGNPGWIARYNNGIVKTVELSLPTAITFDGSGSPIFGANGRIWTIDGAHIKELNIPTFEKSDFNLGPNGAVIPGSGNAPRYIRPVNEISFLYTDRSGSLWIGGSEGLLRYRDGEMRRFTLADGLPSISMVAFLETTSGHIWVGTTSGLARLDGEHFTSFKKADGLGGEFVRSLFEDKDGVLWIGTYDNGIIRYKDGQFRTIAKKDGLFSDGVFCVLEDDDGWFWMNSNQGIYRARRQDLNDFADGRISTVTSAGYGPEDGLANVEGNGGKQPAGLRSSDGRLWFPTAGGLAVIDPQRVHRDEKAPDVFIEEIKVDQKEIPKPDGELVLAPGQTALEINYSGIKFDNPDRLRFRYILEGLDENWTEAGTRRTAYFSHLPYGEYTFRVLAANRDGVWNEQGAAMRVVIDRPFHSTFWFYALVSALVIGFLAVIFLARVRQLRSIADARELYARQLLESQEHERTRLAMELHDSLGQSLVVIRNRALLGMSKRDYDQAMFEQLQEISEASATALQETREIAHTLHPYQIEALGLATALHTLIEKFEHSSQIAFSVDIDQKVADVRHDIAIAVYRITQEWLTNVVKHSSAAEVSVSVHSDPTKLSLGITDDGVGFDPEAVKKGLGLNGIEERARMIGGKLSIVSAPGSGAALRLMVYLT